MVTPEPVRYENVWQIQQDSQFSSRASNLQHLQRNMQDAYYAPYASYSTPYTQPHNESTSTMPCVAELPAPLPPAPPTTTSSQQLKEDGLLAHKLSRIDLADARSRSGSAVSQHQRAVSMAMLGPQDWVPPMHRDSSQLLRSHSQSLSSVGEPWSPGSYGSALNQTSPSVPPEVIFGPRPAFFRPSSSTENLPIPVLQEQTNLQRVFTYDSSNLSVYLEQHRRVPYPHQWILPDIASTLYAHQESPVVLGSDWTDTPGTCFWRSVRHTDTANIPASSSYSFKFKTSTGSFRSPRLSWVMTCPEEVTGTSQKSLSKSRPQDWAYDLKLNSNTGVRKTEILNHGKAKAILTTYVHAMNYDSLRFVGPDGYLYMWVSSTTVSMLNGRRYDTLRHALFCATGSIPDPLFGQIVADHAFWDGHVDENEVHSGIACDSCQAKPINGLRWKCRSCEHHDVCNNCLERARSGQSTESMLPACDMIIVNLPDEVLCIRSATIDAALVVATLQILKDWEKRTLRDEKRNHTRDFIANENIVRRSRLGLKSHWKSGD